MYTYIYYFTMLFFVLAHAKIDAKEIKEGKTINHKLESLIFALTCILSTILLFPDTMSFLKWGIFCGITCLWLRMGFYDFSLNLFRGKSMWYISQNADGNYTGTKESWYDDLLKKLGINANYIRSASLIAAILWLFLHKKFLN